MSEKTPDAILKDKLAINATIDMTRDDVTEAIQQWIHDNYGVMVPNFNVRFLEDVDISEAKCHHEIVNVRLHSEDVRVILNRYEGIGLETKLEVE